MDKYRFSINARFLTQPMTGVQRYSLEVVNALDNLFVPNQAVAFCPSDSRINVIWKNIHLKTGGLLKGNLWEQFDLPLLTRGTVLFSPANIGSLLTHHQVVTIHDTSVFAHPEAYTLPFRIKYQSIYRSMARMADHIITVSEFTKQELQHWLRLAPERISVIYEGWEHLDKISVDTKVLERLSIGGKPFFIVVGSNSPHKNLKVVLEANMLLDQDRYEIVLIGGDFSKVFHSTHLELAPNIKKVGYLSDQELKALYCEAKALIFPSLYEGFGLPLVEAMACSCPVICSDIPSCREVCGNAALYFNSEEPEDLADKLVLLLNRPNLEEELKECGLQRSGNFSWMRTAQETKQILEKYL
jgi:glycosyltransferase involved in cell wall biosynthesis